MIGTLAVLGALIDYNSGEKYGQDDQNFNDFHKKSKIMEMALVKCCGYTLESYLFRFSVGIDKLAYKLKVINKGIILPYY